MIYLFFGDDTKSKYVSYEKFMASVPKSTETFFISRNNFNPVQIESLYSGGSLFSAVCAAIFQNVLETEEMRSFILDKLKFMSESDNSFVFLEGKLTKLTLDTFKKMGSKLNLFELPKEKKEKYDNFQIASAFANKDKFNTWIHFRQAVDRGVAMEELVGILFWKLKDALLKRNFNIFSEKELQNFVSRLSYLLPEARTEGRDAEAAFEQFLLGAF